MFTCSMIYLSGPMNDSLLVILTIRFCSGRIRFASAQDPEHDFIIQYVVKAAVMNFHQHLSSYNLI